MKENFFTGLRKSITTVFFLLPLMLHGQEKSLVFLEENGLVAVEAEFYCNQTNTDVRSWYKTHQGVIPEVAPDPDDPHLVGASYNAYIEVLPDSRNIHTDPLVQGVNFTEEAGKMAVVYYKVQINNPGRYYVWARAFCSGSEDNGLHVGLDNMWPEHGQRMQWCDAFGRWAWACKQRTETQHCGVPMAIYLDIDKPGVHDIQFSLREDGFELDKFILTKDPGFIPEGEGPVMKLANNKVPPAYPKVDMNIARSNKANAARSYFERLVDSMEGNYAMSATYFPVSNTDFYIDKYWLAINPALKKEARTTALFPHNSGNYDIIFVAVGENDGKSTFELLVNEKVAGEFTVPLSESAFEEGSRFNNMWEKVEIKKGDKITVISKIGSKDGKEYSRGRWGGIIFVPAANGKVFIEKSKDILP